MCSSDGSMAGTFLHYEGMLVFANRSNKSKGNECIDIYKLISGTTTSFSTHSQCVTNLNYPCAKREAPNKYPRLTKQHIVFLDEKNISLIGEEGPKESRCLEPTFALVFSACNPCLSRVILLGPLWLLI